MEAEAARTKVTLMSFRELSKSFEYCMSHQASADGMVQQVLGFSRELMMESNDEHSLEDPFFRRLLYSRQKQGRTKTVKVDISEEVRKSKTLIEAGSIIMDAVVAKFEVFLNRPVDKIRAD